MIEIGATSLTVKLLMSMPRKHSFDASQAAIYSESMG